MEPGIPLDIPILSERLKELGYVCGLFGKTHEGDSEEMMAFNRWDEFFGFNNGASNYLPGMNRDHNPIFHNQKIINQSYEKNGISRDEINHKGVLQIDRKQYLTDLIADYALSFIEENQDRPFLCYLPFNAIHGPFQAPKDLYEKYASEKNHQRRLNMAMLDSMDQNIGRVLETLKNLDLEKDTLVIFLSDNGGHEESRHLFASLKQIVGLACKMHAMSVLVIGPKQAKELLLTGNDRVSAQRCYEMGILNRVVADGDEMKAAMGLATQITSAAPRSVQMTKAAIHRSYELAQMRTALLEALETDILIEADVSPERLEFNRIRKEQGLKAALAWRDARA